VTGRHVLAIDQGTTNTKVLLFDRDSAVVARAERPVETRFPQPGWVEQDAIAVWRTVAEAIEECLTRAGGADVAAIGISNQRESVLLWERATGTPLGPIVVWQCRRTSAFCDALRRDGHQAVLEARTGLTIDPLFSGSKIRWLLDAVPDGRRRAEAGELCAGTIDAWLLWNLTGGAVHACDATNASRTQLFNLQARSWDDEVLRVFGVPRALLPEVRPSSGVLGQTVARGALPAGVPVAAAIGDSHAALFGHAAFGAGSVKATYGTGSSLMTPIATPVASRHGLSTTVAWALPAGTTYALEGNITVTGGAVQWIGALLGLSGGSADVAALAATVGDSGGVYVVPALAGLGAPYWDADARGLICGATRGTTGAHVARATIESIAFQVRDVFEAMREDGTTPAVLLADGGASRNADLMQFQADILDRPVVRSDAAELSARGAGWLAGLAAGVWPSVDALAQLPRAVTRFEPRMPAGERDRRLAGWQDAIARTRSQRADSPRKAD
jgi:glycerol kinase